MSAPLAVLCHIPRTGARWRKSLPAAPTLATLATLSWKQATGLQGCCGQRGAEEEGPGGVPGV